MATVYGAAPRAVDVESASEDGVRVRVDAQHPRRRRVYAAAVGPGTRIEACSAANPTRGRMERQMPRREGARQQGACRHTGQTAFEAYQAVLVGAAGAPVVRGKRR